MIKKSLLTAILILLPNIANACSMCFFGDPEQPMNKGLEAGILTLLVILVGIFILFITFFLNFIRRSKALNK